MKRKKYFPVSLFFPFSNITYGRFNTNVDMCVCCCFASFFFTPQTINMSKTLIAELPMMRSKDYAAFEKNGGVWGQQRSIRRQQLTLAAGVAALTGASTWYWAISVRKNTKLVGLGVVVCGSVAGGVIGNYVGTIVYPSVARNDETTMMRRLWWAKRCAEHQ